MAVDILISFVRASTYLALLRPCFVILICIISRSQVAYAYSDPCSDKADFDSINAVATPDGDDYCVGCWSVLQCTPGYSFIRGSSVRTCYPLVGYNPTSSAWSERPMVCGVRQDNAITLDIFTMPIPVKFISTGSSVTFTIIFYAGDLVHWWIYYGNGDYIPYQAFYTNTPFTTHTFTHSYQYKWAGSFQPRFDSRHYHQDGWSDTLYLPVLYVEDPIQGLLINQMPTISTIGESVTSTLSHAVGTGTFQNIVDHGDGQYEYTSGTSVTHSYLKEGNYTSTYTAYNHVSHNSTTHTQHVSVRPQVPNITITVNSPIAYPPGLVIYDIDIDDGPDMVSCPDIFLTWSFGDAALSTRITAAPNLTLLLPHREQFNISSADIGNIMTSVVMNSTYGNGNMSLETVVEIEEAVSNISIILIEGGLTVRTNQHVLQFRVLASGGSNVTYNISYQDGNFYYREMGHNTFVNETTLKLYHIYRQSGHYLPEFCAWNRISRLCVPLSDIIYVQDPVQYLRIARSTAIVALPPGVVEWKLESLDALPPSDLKCDWTLSSEYNTAKMYSHSWPDPTIPHSKQFVLDQHFIGQLTCTISCRNNISSAEIVTNQLTSIKLVQKVQGVNWRLSTFLERVNHPIQLMVTVEEGSHLNATINLGNITTKIFYFGGKIGKYNPLEEELNFAKYGNYSLQIHIGNVVSSVTQIAATPVHIFAQLEGISSRLDEDIIIQGSRIDVITDLLPGYPVQHDVLTKYTIGGREVKAVFSSDMAWELPFTFQLPDSWIGRMVILIHHSNPFDVIEEKFHVMIQEPVPEMGISITASDSIVSSYKPLALNVTSQGGTHLSFSIDYGDLHYDNFSYTSIKDDVENGLFIDKVNTFMDSERSIIIRQYNLSQSTQENSWTGDVHTVIFLHTYTASGNFMIVPHVSNNVSEAQGLGITIKVEHPVLCFVLTSDDVAPVPFGTVNTTLQLCSEFIPTHAKCNFTIEGELIKTATMNISHDHDLYELLVLNHDPGLVLLEVICFNNISSISSSANITLVEVVSGIHIYSDGHVISVTEPMVLNISLERGTEFVIDVDFGDGASKTYYQHKLFTEVRHQYTAAGTYPVRVSVFNNFSHKSSALALNVQETITSLSLNGSNVVALPDGNITLNAVGTSYLTGVLYVWQVFKIIGTQEIIQCKKTEIDDDHLDCPCPEDGLYMVKLNTSNDISFQYTETTVDCYEAITGVSINVQAAGITAENNNYFNAPESSVFSFSPNVANGSRILYKWTVDGEEPITNEEFTKTFQSPGVKTVVLHASNPVTSVSMEINIELFIVVSIKSCRPTSRPAKGLPVEFVLSFWKRGDKTCYLVDFGDGSNIRAFGRFCPSNYQELQATLEMNNFHFTHVYSVEGIYYLDVTAFNAISRDVHKTAVAVNKVFCYPAETRIEGLQNITISRNSPLVFKSQVYVNCTASVKVIYKWTIVTYEDQAPVPLTGIESHLSSIVLPEFFFSINNYKLILEIEMEGVYGSATVQELNIEVLASPLSVGIRGGPKAKIQTGQTIVLDGRNLTTDPDASVLTDTVRNINMSWHCQPVYIQNKRDVVPRLFPATSIDFTRCGLNNYTVIAPDYILVDSKVLTVGHVYQFTLFVQIYEREASATQNVDVVAGDPPTVTLKCLRNCDFHMAVHSSMVLVIQCDSCSPKEKEESRFRWQLRREMVDTNDIRNVEEIQKLVTGDLRSSQFILKLNALQPGFVYQAEAALDLPGQEPAEVVHRFIATAPPRGGSCRVDKNSGFSFETIFTIHCTDWISPSINQDDSGLSYSLLMQSARTGDEAIIAFSYEEQTKTILPPGLKENDYKVTLTVAISTQLRVKAFYRLDLVTVLPPDDTEKMINNHILQDNGMLDKAFSARDISHIIAQLSTAIELAKVVENDEDKKPTVDLLYVKVTKIVLELSKTVQLPDELEMITKALKEVRPKTPSRITKENMKEAVANIFAEIKVTTKTIEERDALLTECLDTIGYLLVSESELVNEKEDAIILISAIDDAVLIANVEDGVESPKQRKRRLALQNRQNQEKIRQAKIQAQEFSEKLVGLVSDVLETMTQGRFHRECVQGANTPSIKLIVQHAPGLDEKDQCQETLSINSQDFGGCKNCSIQEAKFFKNPFVYSSGSRDVTSEVSMLKVKDQEGNEVPLASNGRSKISLTQHKSSKMLMTEMYPIKNEQFRRHLVYVESENLQLEVHLEALPMNFLNSTFDMRLLAWNDTANTSIDVSDILQKEDRRDRMEYTFIAEAGKLKKSKHFVQVHSYDRGGHAIPLQSYRIGFMLSGCLRHETHSWSPITCKMSVSKTAVEKRSLKDAVKALISIESNYTGSLAAGIFLPPNMIDFNAVFRDLGDRILDSPVVLTVVIVITCIYLILLIWARHQDKLDYLKISVFPATGNSVYNTQVYRLYIHTGLRLGASTKSRVYVKITGEKSSTTTRRLDGFWHNGFSAGSVIMYDINTQEDLGDLEYMQVWIDNSGPGRSRDWYLDEIAIEDLSTRQRYMFICHQWLSLERGNGKLEKLLTVAGDENTKDFLHLIQAWLRHKFFDAHLWLSVWQRPRRSNFTRMQRLTCCYTLLFLMMVVNAMWYRTGDEVQEELFTLEIGLVVITYSQIYVSIMSTLIMFPISLVIVQAFRRTDAIHRNLSETMEDFKAYRRKHLVNKSFQASENISRQYEVVTESVWKVTSERQWPYVCVYLGWIVCVLTSVFSAFFTIMYSLYWGGDIANKWLASFLMCAAQSISVVALVQVLMVVFFLSLLHKVPSEEELDDEEIIMIDDAESRLVDLYLHNNAQYIIESTRDHVDHAPNALEKLDYQVQILDLVVQKRAEEWDYATSTATDTASSIIEEEILIGDPLKFTLNHDRFSTGPPQGIEADRMRKIQLFIAQKKEVIIGAIMRLFYIACLLVMVFGITNPEALNITNHVKHMFSQGNTDFHHLSGPKAFWHWTENTLLPGLYAGSLYNGHPASWRDRLFISDRESIRLGPVRLRQLRIKPAGCPLIGPLNPLLIECNPKYSFSAEDTKNYYPTWLGENTNVTDSNIAWMYLFSHHDSSDVDGIPIMGTLYTYNGGGYIADLPEEMDDALSYINKLKDLDWLTLYTRAIFVEFSLYNANANMFINTVLLFELPPAGGSVIKFFVESFRVYGAVGTEGIAVFIASLAFIVMLLIYTIITVKKVFLRRCNFFREIASVMDLLQVVLAFVCVATYVVRLTIVSKAVSQVFNAKGTFVSFYPLAVISQTFVLLMGLVVFLNIILLLSLTNISLRFRVAGKILVKGKSVFGSFFLQFGIIITAFAIFFNVYMGVSKSEYSTFPKTIGSLFALFLGGGSSFKASSAISDDVLARTFMFLFSVIVILMFTNFFIGALTDIYSTSTAEVIEENKMEQSDIDDYTSHFMKVFKSRFSKKK